MRLQFPFGVAQQSAASTIAESVSAVLVSCQEDATTEACSLQPLAEYIHTVPFDRLEESLQRARRDAQLQHVVVYGLPVDTASASPSSA